MKENETIEKIRAIITGQSITESHVVHLFSLVRKLLEAMPPMKLSGFQLLRFYCDWALHSKIDRSKKGAVILERIHQIVIDHMARKDNSTMADDLSVALSLDDLGTELNCFLQSNAGDLKIEMTDWMRIIPILVEIISSCPITISRNRKNLRPCINRIRSQPIAKDGATIQEIAIAKISSTLFFPSQTSTTSIFCLVLTLSNTTKIITPIMKPR